MNRRLVKWDDERLKSWSRCPRLSREPVPGTRFLLCKTPLSTCYESKYGGESGMFTVDMAMQAFSRAGHRVGLAIDACGESPETFLHNRTEWEEWDVHVVKLGSSGSGSCDSPPTPEMIDDFIKICNAFFQQDDRGMLLTFDEYGKSRSGALVASFLVKVANMPPLEALHRVNSERTSSGGATVYTAACVQAVFDAAGGVAPTPFPSFAKPKWDTRTPEQVAEWCQPIKETSETHVIVRVPDLPLELPCKGGAEPVIASKGPSIGSAGSAAGAGAGGGSGGGGAAGAPAPPPPPPRSKPPPPTFANGGGSRPVVSQGPAKRARLEAGKSIESPSPVSAVSGAAAAGDAGASASSSSVGKVGPGGHGQASSAVGNPASSGASNGAGGHSGGPSGSHASRSSGGGVGPALPGAAGGAIKLLASPAFASDASRLPPSTVGVGVDIPADHALSKWVSHAFSFLHGAGAPPPPPGAPNASFRNDWPLRQPLRFGAEQLEHTSADGCLITWEPEGYRCAAVRCSDGLALVGAGGNIVYLPANVPPTPPPVGTTGLTLADAVLVKDQPPGGAPPTWRCRLFDTLVVDGKPLFHRSLDSRLGYMQQVASKWRKDFNTPTFRVSPQDYFKPKRAQWLVSTLVPTLQHKASGVLIAYLSRPYHPPPAGKDKAKDKAKTAALHRGFYRIPLNEEEGSAGSVGSSSDGVMPLDEATRALAKLG